MSHGGGGEDGGDPNRWLVSYADFITLLMVLFVVLYSMGQVDVAKYKELANGLKAAFSFPGGASNVIKTDINQGGGSDKSGVPNPIVIPGIPKKQPASVDVASKLSKALSSSKIEGGVSVQQNIEGVPISISEKLAFIPGTVTLQQQPNPGIAQILTLIKPMPNSIKITGHTDNTTPKDRERYPTNLDLSVARASVVANLLIEAGISQKRITIAGQGDQQPLVSNDSTNRSVNNRVEIAIVYPVDSKVISGSNPISGGQPPSQ